MKTNYLFNSAKFAAVAAAISFGANVHATTPQTAQVLSVPMAGQNEFQPVAFTDSAEAGMLRRAYQILATGDHDYKGHRAKAMHSVEAAGKLLGIDLKGDVKVREPQGLSDEKLREASGLISKVLGSAEVKDQKRITKHLNEALDHINTALTIK